MHKNKILINLSNHPFIDWEERQIQAATHYGKVIDIPFPIVDEYADEYYITELALSYLQKIKTMGSPQEVTIHLMGEMTFCFALLKLLQQDKYTCIASTSKRLVENLEPSQKQVTFQFERFRKYE